MFKTMGEPATIKGFPTRLLASGSGAGIIGGYGMIEIGAHR